MKVLRIIGRIDDVRTEHDGRFVSKYDPDVHGPDRSYDGGVLETTEDRERALKFPDVIEAMELWKKSPNCFCHGRRWWDGKPNRPLTMYTVTVEEE